MSHCNLSGSLSAHPCMWFADLDRLHSCLFETANLNSKTELRTVKKNVWTLDCRPDLNDFQLGSLGKVGKTGCETFQVIPDPSNLKDRVSLFTKGVACNISSSKVHWIYPFFAFFCFVESISQEFWTFHPMLWCGLYVLCHQDIQCNDASFLIFCNWRNGCE